MAQSRIRQLGEGDAEYFTQPASEIPAPPGGYGTEIPPPPPRPSERFASTILFASLKALSQRTLIALSNLFVLVTAISAFWLFYTTMAQPTVLQLVGLFLYGVLILLMDWLVLRRW
jgi:hypothetical protein